MKSKHFDTIIMDDLVGDTVSSDALAKELERWATIKRGHDDHVEALTWSTQWVNDPLLPNPDYEAAKDLIREVASAQEETPSP